MDSKVSKNRFKKRHLHDPQPAIPLNAALIEIIREARSTPNDFFIRIEQAVTRSARARATIYKDIDNGVFPPQVEIGEKSVAWKNSEISAWILAMEYASRNQVKIDMKQFVSLLISFPQTNQYPSSDRDEPSSYTLTSPSTHGH
jgi:prophage regulatory protein